VASLKAHAPCDSNESALRRLQGHGTSLELISPQPAADLLGLHQEFLPEHSKSFVFSSKVSSLLMDFASVCETTAESSVPSANWSSV